jgi:hypothetical protein
MKTISIPKSEIVLKNDERLIVDREKGERLKLALQGGASHIELSDFNRTLHKFEIKEIRPTVDVQKVESKFSEGLLDRAEKQLEEYKKQYSPVLAESHWIEHSGAGKVKNEVLIISDPELYEAANDLMRKIVERTERKEYSESKRLEELDDMRKSLQAQGVIR